MSKHGRLGNFEVPEPWSDTGASHAGLSSTRLWNLPTQPASFDGDQTWDASSLGPLGIVPRLASVVESSNRNAIVLPLRPLNQFESPPSRKRLGSAWRSGLGARLRRLLATSTPRETTSMSWLGRSRKPVAPGARSRMIGSSCKGTASRWSSRSSPGSATKSAAAESSPLKGNSQRPEIAGVGLRAARLTNGPSHLVMRNSRENLRGARGVRDTIRKFPLPFLILFRSLLDFGPLTTGRPSSRWRDGDPRWLSQGGCCPVRRNLNLGDRFR